MEDLISIVVLILYFVAASASKKNKKQKKAKRQAANGRKARFDQAFERMMDAVAAESAPKTEAMPDMKAEQADWALEEEGTDPCHDAMLSPQMPSMHVKTVSQEEMLAAGEGADPCHYGAVSDERGFDDESPVYRSPILNIEDKEAFAQDVLRGVVMSEVLRRPKHRAAGAGMKRGA